MITSSISKI